VSYLDKDVQNAFQSRWISARRSAWIESQGGCCRSCGSRESLEVDHVDRTNKSVNPSRLWSLAENNPLRVSELAKCQVLCRSCHRAKTRGEFAHEFPHGRYQTYKRGCRCGECRLANAERRRQQRNRLTA
jgi:5-methylcytosine-specific restriction endonuclease McrA